MMEHSFLFLETATSTTGSSAKVHDNFKPYTILVLFASDLLMCLTAIKSLEATGGGMHSATEPQSRAPTVERTGEGVSQLCTWVTQVSNNPHVQYV